jgi:hypothetical protein
MWGENTVNKEIIKRIEKRGSTWGNRLWWRNLIRTVGLIFILFAGTYIVISGANSLSEGYQIETLTKRLADMKFQINDIEQKAKDLEYNIIIESILKLQPKLDKEVAKKISNAIIENCIEKELSPYLVICLMFVESGFNQMATSSKMAIGLMQVHWKSWKSHEFCKDAETKEDLYQIDININCGTSILKKMIKDGGSVRAGLNSYYGVESNGYHDKMASALYQIMF